MIRANDFWRAGNFRGAFGTDIANVGQLATTQRRKSDPKHVIHQSTFDCFLVCRTASPSPKANEYLVKEKFYAEMAKAKNAPALGVEVPGKGTGYPAPNGIQLSKK
ncbi:MAG: hypothetical protein K8R28_04945 [Desulfobacterales bacterium]|nr:hypothetical protein [Desulfobacterales bacterium]